MPHNSNQEWTGAHDELAGARRERDEARKERGEASAAHASAAATNRRYNAKLLEADKRLAQAVALLRDALHVVDVVADGHTFDQLEAADIAERIAAALAEIGGVK